MNSGATFATPSNPFLLYAEELAQALTNICADPDYIGPRSDRGRRPFRCRFLGINPLEAKVMDPQQRVFLELAQFRRSKRRLRPGALRGRIGVLPASRQPLLHHQFSSPTDHWQWPQVGRRVRQPEDYIALRTAYLLDATRPSDQPKYRLLHHSRWRWIRPAARSSTMSVTWRSPAASTSPSAKKRLSSSRGRHVCQGRPCRPFDATRPEPCFCDGARRRPPQAARPISRRCDTIYA